MPMLQSSIHVFQRVARRCKDSRFSRILSAGPIIYATDTVIALRSSAFTAPDAIPDNSALDTLTRLFDQYSNAAGLRLAALGPKAKCPGKYPTIAENLRAYARYSKKQGEKATFYPVGDCMVDASLLADVLTAIPDACVYAIPGEPYKPLFFRGAYAEGILLPVRLNMQRIGQHLQILADYQRESGEQGANPSRPFMTLPLDKIAEQAAEEARRQQEAQRQLEREWEAYIRKRQAEEAAQREQAEKEKAEKRESTRKILLSNGEDMPVDGQTLCELAAELGVSIPLRTKGFILKKLATITIADGQFKRYTFRAKKGAQGSDACFKYIQALIDALKMQPIEAASENPPENNVPELENQAANLENPAAKESNSRIHNIRPDETPSHDEQLPENNGAQSDVQPTILPQNGAQSTNQPANPSRKRKKPNPEKHRTMRKKNAADKTMLQTFIESDLSRFGHVTAETQSALQFQGYFWNGSKLCKCKKPLHVYSVSSE